MTANPYGPTAAQTPGWGQSFSVPSFTVDTKGRLTAAGAHNVTIPGDLATSSTTGLMSSTQYDLISGNQPRDMFLAGPTGGPDATPAYRAIVWTDIPNEIIANTSGNAATATTLATARSISITGGATAAGVNFDGSGNVALDVTALDGTLMTNLDASKLTTGTVPVARLLVANSTDKGTLPANMYKILYKHSRPSRSLGTTDADCQAVFAAIPTRRA
ncbi:hypothetical protein AGMMS49525_16320 [Bacteroidia bacterium]|nr:hypothetical protein AGMMS49525_16320 [Bacteroidia bacterium]